MFNLRYPGQYFDSESGLFYNWHRSYDPQTGRYTQPDPLGLEGGWNRFTYVENNPLWASDPQGLLFMTTVEGVRRDIPLSQAATLGAPGNAAAAVGATGFAAGVVAAPIIYWGGKQALTHIKIDGPSPGLVYGNGRVCQIRWNKQPIIRLDYHPYPGTKGQSRLHINILNEKTHISVDPRSISD